MYLRMFELRGSIHKGQATQPEFTVYTEVEPLDGFRCIPRRGAGVSRELFFCLGVEESNCASLQVYCSP